jgi:hypothetical protein
LGKPTTPSARAARVWQRLTEWYGVRLAESYGATIPADWAEVVNDVDNDTVKRGLAIIRARYVQHPPTLPQFDQAMRPLGNMQKLGPSPSERLCAHIMKQHGDKLTLRQRARPWTYIGTPAGEISGVVIDADGTAPGYRVMLADIDGGQQDWFDATIKHKGIANADT